MRTHSKVTLTLPTADIALLGPFRMVGQVAKVHYDGYFVGGRMTGKKFDTSRGRLDDFGKEDFYRFKLGEEHEAVRDGWVIRGFTVRWC